MTAIQAAAADTDADVGVLGARGLDAVKSLILGRVTRAVLSQADRPVLAIASLAVAARSGQAVEHVRLMGRAA